MSTVPIVTIAWQQPAKWIGVEEHVRRGRIRNRGELTAGMTVQVMYKKGWYKAKVINPDPLKPRNRTKKSCACCTSPVKHTHHIGRDRRRGSKGQTSTSESEATTDGATIESLHTDTDSKTESEGGKLPTETDLKAVEGSGASSSNGENGDQQVIGETKKGSGVKGESEVNNQRNIFDNVSVKQMVDNASSGGDAGAESVGQQFQVENDEKAEVGDIMVEGDESSTDMKIQGNGDQQGVMGEETKENLDNNNITETNDQLRNKDGESMEGKNEAEEMMEVEQQVAAENEHVQNESQQGAEEKQTLMETDLKIAESNLNKEDHIQEPVLVEQNPVEPMASDKPVAAQVPLKEQVTEVTTVAASQQIANEHMYSQRMPVVASQEEDLPTERIINGSVVTTENDAQNPKDDVEASHEASGSSLPGAESAADDKADDAYVDSETAGVSDAVNVVYLRPSDIHMSTEDDDSQTNSTEQNEEESIDHDKEQHAETDENEQRPVELQMAQPDEPLGQIKISEPVSLAGTEQEHPLELTTPKQTSSDDSNQPESEQGSSKPPAGGGKPAEIKHKSKGLVAHQTTLPSGRPGPIILTMKNKKPKHKKSKKKNKHKDKDKERSKEIVASPPGLVHIRPAPQPQKPTEPQQRAASHLHVAAAVAPPNVPQKQLPPVSRQSSNMATRHPPPAHGQVQSPPLRRPPQSVAMMRSPNVIVSADGSMRHSEPGLIVAADGTIRQIAEPIRHIEPPRAHMVPRQQQQQQPPRGPAPGGRSHSQSSQPSPGSSPPNAHHHPQWYPVNMPPHHHHHHPRMAEPGPPPHGHPGHPHMTPSDFANMRARHPQPYHSGLPSHVEASFSGAPQFIRGGSPNQHPMGNAPSPAEAAYIRAQSLARQCHHPHWQPNGPPHFVRDPHMHGPGSVLRVPRYGHPQYPRMPSDMPPGAGRPPPLIPAPGPGQQHPRSLHPVSIHKIRPDAPQHPSRPGGVANAASPNSITPRSSTSESVQSISPQNVAQKRPRDPPPPAEIESIIAQQFQEGTDGERVIGVAELLELRNALRRHHGFTEKPPAKSPRLETAMNPNQPGVCPPMLASVGLQPRPPSGPIDPSLQQVMPGNASSPRLQHLAMPPVPHPAGEQPQVVQVGTSQPNQIESINRATTQNPVPASNPQNVARQWVAEAQQLYPSTSAIQTIDTSNNATASTQPSVTVPATTRSDSVPAVPPLVQKPTQATGRSVQRSGRKQKTPHRRPTVDDSVVIKAEPIDPGYEAAEENMDVISNAETIESREQTSDGVINRPGSNSLDSAESEETPSELRSSGSGPISQLQTLCTRLSSSRTSIIPSQSLQHVPPAHIVQEQNQTVRPPSSGHSSPANPQVRQIPPLMQEMSSHVLDNQRQSQVLNSDNVSAGVAAAVAQPVSPVEIEPTSSGLNESAPSPDTSTAAKVDKDADLSRRLSFLEREMGIVKSWLWEIRTILTSRTGGGIARKGLPKCTDVGDGNVVIGSGEHTIAIARSDYLDCWDKTDNAKDLIVKLISKVFTEEELAMSSYNGGMIRSTYKRRLIDDQRFNAILAQAEKEYGAGNLEDRKAIREAVNNKCRKKAFKFRQQEAITQRISQQYQMYKE